MFQFIVGQSTGLKHTHFVYAWWCVRVCLGVGKALVKKLNSTPFQVAKLTDLSAGSWVICTWCTCENKLKPETDTGITSSITSPTCFLRQHWTWTLPFRLNCCPEIPTGFTCLHCLSARGTDICDHTWILYGYWSQNSSPLACTATTLHMELAPRPVFLFWGRVSLNCPGQPHICDYTSVFYSECFSFCRRNLAKQPSCNAGKFTADTFSLSQLRICLHG